MESTLNGFRRLEAPPLLAVGGAALLRYPGAPCANGWGIRAPEVASPSAALSSFPGE